MHRLGLIIIEKSFLLICLHAANVIVALDQLFLHIYCLQLIVPFHESLQGYLLAQLLGETVFEILLVDV
jgi:hypothetical protein